jgi:NAD(P)-dependent dehydrogenase (short-subunit alcohol dehydrogenase family)
MTQKIALITGASRGLGAALALAFSRTHHIVAVARTTGALEELDDRIQAQGGHATLAPMDITNTDAMAQLCRSIYDRWGQIDLWAHTAVHAAPLSPASSIDGRDWEKSVAINISATGVLIPFIQPLLGETGQALFFEDTHVVGKFTGSYSATKTAQITLARAWAAETVKTGPKVHVLAPAPRPTAPRARFFPGEDRSPLSPPDTEAAAVLAALA